MACLQTKKVTGFYISNILLGLLITLNFCLSKSFSEDTNISFTKIQELNNFPVTIPISEGNTNGDSTYEDTDYFADLDSQANADYLSLGIFKNNSVRILKLNKQDGSLTLLDSQAFTDPIVSGSQAAIRGPNINTPDGRALFFLGNGPADAGFDKIYFYKVSSEKVEREGDNYFFIPSDLPRSLRVTPNGKYLVYLQASTANNNLASIQSVEIKENTTLGEAFIGQSISDELQAGTNLEFASGLGLKDRENIIGIFSNFQQGGSGDGFAIFKTNQVSGVNTILKEFKKDSKNNLLPIVFYNLSFVGFSGFELVEKNSETYLFVSYVENSSISLPGYDYITKVAIFKVLNSNNSAELIQIGTPVETIVQLSPCNEKKFQGISGQIKVVDNILYIADNNSTQDRNYFAAYNIDWESVSNGGNNNKNLTLASVPKKINEIKGERATDLIILKENNLAYLTTIQPKGASNAKITGYTLEHTNISEPQFLNELNKNGICIKDLERTIEPDVESAKPTKEFKEPDTPKDITKGIPNFSVPPQGIIQGIGSSQQGGATAGRPSLFGSTTSSTSQSTFSQPPSSLFERPKPSQGLPGTTFQETINEFLTEIIATIEQPPGSPRESTVKEGKIIQEPIKQDVIPSQEGDLLDLLLLEAEEVEKEVEGDLEIEGLDLVLLSTETSPLEVTTLKISDIKSLDLSGKDQIIIAPKVPWISTDVEAFQEAKIETVGNNDNKKDKASKQEDLKTTRAKDNKEKIKLIQVSELNGAINKGYGGYLITLKDNIKLKKKDLDDITYVVINKKEEVTEIDGETLDLISGKIFAKLSFENIKEKGSYKLIALLDKGNDKKEVISKGGIDIFNSYEFENIGKKLIKINKEPTINRIDGRLIGDSYKGGKIVRLVLHGNNFASRLIVVKNKFFISHSLTTNTSVSFVSNKNIETIRTRVLSKGSKMLVVMRVPDPDISSVPVTISTPYGQFLKEKIGIKLLTGSTQRSTKLELD